MNGKKLHTTLLANLFGPIKLHILKQEKEYRIVHLRDANDISRTMAIVRFKNISHPLIKEIHTRVLTGSMLGKTLLEAKVPYEKSYVSSFTLSLPNWLEQDFKTDKKSSLAIYSQINIMNESGNDQFLYADLFEVIPPEILNLFPAPDTTLNGLSKDIISLLNYANISTDHIANKL